MPPGLKGHIQIYGSYFVKGHVGFGAGITAIEIQLAPGSVQTLPWPTSAAVLPIPMEHLLMPLEVWGLPAVASLSELHTMLIAYSTTKLL